MFLQPAAQEMDLRERKNFKESDQEKKAKCENKVPARL